MRWQEPDFGDTRIVLRFAVFPIKAGRETRWLEFVKIQQWWHGGWGNKEFVN